MPSSNSSILAVGLLVASACASSQARAPAPAVPGAPPAATAPAAPAASLEPGYRARIVFSGVTIEGRRHLVDSWAVIHVQGSEARHKDACGKWLLGEMAWRTRRGFDARVTSECSLDPLPAVAHEEGFVLADVETLDAIGLSAASFMLAAPADAADAEPAEPDDAPAPEDVPPVTAVLSRYTRFPTQATCETSRDQLVAGRQQEPDSAGTWLRKELERHQQERDRACTPRPDLDQHCTELAAGTSVEAACKRAPRSRQCKAAVERSFELKSCQDERQMHASSCASHEQMVKLLEERIAAEAAKPPRPLPTCTPG